MTDIMNTSSPCIRSPTPDYKPFMANEAFRMVLSYYVFHATSLVSCWRTLGLILNTETQPGWAFGPKHSSCKAKLIGSYFHWLSLNYTLTFLTKGDCIWKTRKEKCVVYQLCLFNTECGVKSQHYIQILDDITFHLKSWCSVWLVNLRWTIFWNMTIHCRDSWSTSKQHSTTWNAHQFSLWSWSTCLLSSNVNIKCEAGILVNCIVICCCSIGATKISDEMLTKSDSVLQSNHCITWIMFKMQYSFVLWANSLVPSRVF